MADTTAPAPSSDDNEPQVTFNVKSSSEAKYVLTLAASTTVADLKTRLSTSEYADLPPARQRLIYSGRVLKDHDTLGSCKIKDGNTVHLVRGADSNQRQNPANQGGTATAAAPAGNVPSNIAAGTGANNPLAQLTGARYAGFHQLPGAEMFGPDGGMAGAPNPDQMLRMLEDPNFAQQMNEAMNNPAVIEMLRNNPMIRDNPMAQAAINNPEMRRMMMDPNMIRMQMNMQRAMGGGGSNFPMPGQTDTTQPAEGGGNNNTAAPNQPNPAGMPNLFGNANPSAAANPFAQLFGGGNPAAAQGTTPAQSPPIGSAGQTPSTGAENQQNTQQPPNPFASVFGQQGGGAGGSNPMAMAQQMMQNPEMMRQAMQFMGGMGGGEPGLANPFGGMGAFGQQEQPQQPADTRPPEERYAEQLRQLNDMGFYEFERNVQALRRSGGSVQGAVEHLLSGL